jgi:L-threonylcarbamoyladenylate synthase
MSAERATQIMPAGDVATAAAAGVLRQRGLVAFPTETVYGLGADAENGEAVARLYEAKGRPSFNPLIAHVLDAAAARRLARFNPAAERLAAKFWPGPLTLVLPKAPICSVAELATAGLDTIAVRVPSHPVAREILAAFAKPVVAPSANRSGTVSPTTAQHVLHDLRDRIDLLVNDGPAPLGIESTIVACLDGPALLRPGAEAAAATLNLSARGDLVEAAANLFSHLRSLDTEAATAIAVVPIPDRGLGEAINDRLRHAAAPREAVAVTK